MKKLSLILGIAFVASGVALEAAATDPIAGLDRRVHVGARIEIEGSPVSPGVWEADEIELKEGGDDDIELRGLIDSVDRDRRSVSLLGFDVRTDGETELSHDDGTAVGFADLESGLRVRVDGEFRADGSFFAERIRIRSNQRYREQKIEGRIEDVVAGGVAPTLQVAGIDVRLSESTMLVGLKGRSRPIVRGRLGFVDDDDVVFGAGGGTRRRIALAGEVRTRIQALSYAELDPELDDREIVPEISGVIGAAINFPGVFAYLEAAGEREFFIESLAPFDEPNSFLRVTQAYFELTRTGVPWLSLAVGRQKFDEEREWLYNAKNLDGVRLLADFYPVTVEASISRDIFDSTRNLRDQDKTNTIVRVAYEASDDLTMEAYYIRRDDRALIEDSPRIYAFRALGESGRKVEYWADLAIDRGQRGVLDVSSGEVFVRSIDAYAFDVGMTYRPRRRWDPTFTLSYALGSGERDPSASDLAESEDRTFRQTDLERNRWRYNGVVSFRYYGEVFDPELTNLRIVTAGWGMRPRRPFSVDLIYHRYRQDAPSRRLRGSDVEANPSGDDPHLGDEIDLIVGYEPSRKYELRFNAGWFLPGAAFDDDARVARSVRLQAKFRF